MLMQLTSSQTGFPAFVRVDISKCWTSSPSFNSVLIGHGQPQSRLPLLSQAPKISRQD